MTDIMSALLHFQSVCSELKVEPHPYIAKMLDREHRSWMLEKKENTRMHLYLAGNNKALCQRRINDDDCPLLARFLDKNVFVKSVDLRYNEITDDGVKILADLLTENTTLEEMNLMCNNIGPEGAKHLAKALHTNETLKTLRLTGNKMETKEVRGGMFFAQALQVNTTLEHLDLGDTDLRIGSVIALATVLVNNNTLKSLNINRPILFTNTEENTVHLAAMLKMVAIAPSQDVGRHGNDFWNNMSLEELHLQKSDMQDFGASRLAENLTHNLTLKYLDLSCNRITRDGMKQLSHVLKQDTALETLDVGFNRLEDEGAIYIAEAISTANTRLKCLVLVYNNVTSVGICALADAMAINTTLTNIYMWGNHLQPPASTAIDRLMKSDRLLPRNTDVRPYVVDGVIHLAELNHHIHRHYYYAGIYGDDVPEWQIPPLGRRGGPETHTCRYLEADVRNSILYFITQILT